MTILINLSQSSILSAIHQLEQIKDDIRWGLNESIDILTKEGTMIAQDADGSMAYVVGYMPEENTGMIFATGDAPVIAEFGAGDATLDPANLFTNDPPVPVYPGSYSESDEGTGMYATLGWWKFGGKIYTEVETRQGLYKAKQYILENAEETVREVIDL